MVATNVLVRYALAFAVPCYAASNMKMVDSVQKAALEQRGWTVQRTPAVDEPITLQIGLTLQNEDALIAKLKDVSDPKSPNYGKFLDRDEANSLAKPALDASDTVVKWLKDSGVSTVTSDGFWVTFRTTIDKANELLAADFQQYQNDGVSKIRTAQYSVPMEVSQHIDLIHPTTFFGKTQAFAPVHIVQSNNQLEGRQLRATPTPKGKQQDPAALPLDASCKSQITPNCLKQLYNVGSYTPSATSGSRLGFGSFLNESSNHADLKLYTDRFKIPFQDVTKINVNGAKDDQGPGASNGEANLDVQNMVGVGHPLPVYEFLTGGQPPFIPDLDLPNGDTNTNEPYVPYYQYLLNKTNAELPQAISNSYGEPEHTVPKNYAVRTCLMVAVLGLRGITVFESSGDTGIGSNCLSNDGQNRREFNPQFPGTCPWITSVGGTEASSHLLWFIHLSSEPSTLTIFLGSPA
jgi:tripeptidyl-peptidase-1